jgi:hypothetical protein
LVTGFIVHTDAQSLSRCEGSGTLVRFARVPGVGNDGDALEPGQYLLHQFNALADEVNGHKLHTGHVAARPRQARDQFSGDHVATGANDQRDGFGGLRHGLDGGALHHDHGRVLGDDLRNHLLHSLLGKLRIIGFEPNGLSVHQTARAQAILNGIEVRPHRLLIRIAQPDHQRQLRLRENRQGSRGSGQPGETQKVTTSHIDPPE